MSFWCLQIFQKTNEIFSRISSLASKKRSNQKMQWRILFYSLTPLFSFDLFLEARAEKFHWYFGPNLNTKRTFWNQLTFSTMGPKPFWSCSWFFYLSVSQDIFAFLVLSAKWNSNEKWKKFWTHCELTSLIIKSCFEYYCCLLKWLEVIFLLF